MICILIQFINFFICSYDKKSKYLDYGYEDILERHLLSLIKDCDRRIESAKRRIEENERAMVCIHIFDIITLYHVTH